MQEARHSDVPVGGRGKESTIAAASAEAKHLSQHIEFPATGESDPFSRIDDVDGWFGDVYARAADKD